MLDLAGYLDWLQQAGFMEPLTEQESTQLKTQLSASPEMNTADILGLVGLVVDIRDRKVTGIEDYLALLADLQTLSGNLLDYEELRAERLESEDHDNAYQIHFNFREQAYFMDIYIYKWSDKIETYPVERVLNWALAENNIEHRFHIVSRSIRIGRTETVGFIFLHPDQYEIFVEHNKSALKLSSAANITTRATVNAWLEGFQELGLLDHLDDEQIAHLKTTLNPPRVHKPLHLFYEIPDLGFSFDAECLYILQEDLANLLKDVFAYVDESLELNHISAERQSANETVLFDEDILLKFQFQGKDYEVLLRYMGDWVDVEYFTKAINGILQENNFPRQLINIDTESQTVTLIYATEEKFAQLQASPLLEVYHYL